MVVRQTAFEVVSREDIRFQYLRICPVRRRLLVLRLFVEASLETLSPNLRAME